MLCSWWMTPSQPASVSPPPAAPNFHEISESKEHSEFQEMYFGASLRDGWSLEKTQAVKGLERDRQPSTLVQLKWLVFIFCLY